MGVVGTAFGFGIDLLTEVDTEEAAFGIAGAGSIAGLLVGHRLTRTFDHGKTFAAGSRPGANQGLSLEPGIAFASDATGNSVPVLSVRATF